MNNVWRIVEGVVAASQSSAQVLNNGQIAGFDLGLKAACTNQGLEWLVIGEYITQKHASAPSLYNLYM